MRTIGESAGRPTFRSNVIKVLKVALILFLAWLPASWLLGHLLVIDNPTDHTDALVVLGGSAEYIERSSKAAERFHQGAAPMIVLTNDGRRGGWNQEEQRNPFFVESAYARLVDGGVPREAIVILPDVTDSTHDEAAVVLNFATARNLNSIELVTSPYHTRRALYIFETYRGRIGSQCILGISSRRGGILDPASLIWWTSPTTLKLVASEYLKLSYFWIAG